MAIVCHVSLGSACGSEGCQRPGPWRGTAPGPPEHEVAYPALRHTLLAVRVPPQVTRPACSRRWALLDPVPGAADSHHRCHLHHPGHRSDRTSYQIAIQTAQTLVTCGSDLADDICRAFLASLHGPGRPRVRARRVKVTAVTLGHVPADKPAICQPGLPKIMSTRFRESCV